LAQAREMLRGTRESTGGRGGPALGEALKDGRESRPADKGVTLAGVSSGGPTEDIEDMTADQIRVEIQEARNRLALKDQMLCELLRARSAVPKLKLEVRAMVHALHAVRKELAQSNQLVQSLHTQMTFERQKTDELQRLKDAPPTQADLQAKDARLQELESACTQLREMIAAKEREQARPSGVEPGPSTRDASAPRLAAGARPGASLVLSGGSPTAFGRPEHSLTVGTYAARREMDLPFTRSVGSYEAGRTSPSQGPGRLAVSAPYDDFRATTISGGRAEEDQGQVRFLLGRTATSMSSAQLGGTGLARPYVRPS